MFKKYLKVFSILIKNNISFPQIVKDITQYLIYFILLNIIFTNIRYFSNYSNINLSLIAGGYILIILMHKYFYENALIFRYLLITDNFGIILLKPINSLLRLLVNKIDFVGFILLILISTTIVYFGSFGYLLLIFSGLIISLSIFIFVLSILLISSGKFPWEKLLLSLFLIGFLGLVNIVGLCLVFLLSIILLIFSIKFWKHAITRYTSASS